MKNKKFTFGSVCSGIEAASVAWDDFGEALWFAEIEPFPSAVLSHHYPNVPNLGDMTTIAARIRDGSVPAPDVLVGGTPCQSWSIAGSRKGRDDPRGELTFSFIDIIQASRPSVVVWENVPGILSADGGGSFCDFMDAILALGYIINADILDAQFFGLAQRRRRVFLVCQRADILMNQKSSTSLSIGLLAVLGILQDILAVHQVGLEKKHGHLGVKCKNVNAGLKRKTIPFLIHGGEVLESWLLKLADTCLSAAAERGRLVSNLGYGIKMEEDTHQKGVTGLLDIGEKTEGHHEPYLNTSLSWRTELADLFSIQSRFTTSTELKQITLPKISIYAEMLSIIGVYIALSKDSCPAFLKLTSLHLILTQEFINYARKANEPVFRGSRVYGFCDNFRRKANETAEIIASARDGFDPSKILLEFGGVRRDIAPSREAKQNPTTDVGCGIIGGGQWWSGGEVADTLTRTSDDQRMPDKNRFQCVVGCRMTAFGEYVTDETASTMKARDYKDATDLAVISFHPLQDPIPNTDGLSHALSCGSTKGQSSVAVAYGVPGNWIGRAPENGGNATEPPFNLSPCLTATDRHGVAYSFDSLASNSMKSKNPHSGCREVDLSKTLDTSTPEPSKNQGGIAILSLSSKQQALTIGSNIANTLGASDFKEPQAVSVTGLAVRRLTVTECERLQGFPDGYTRIPWRKKPADDCPDGPRYRALGNSMAVPVMRWIGSRVFDFLFDKWQHES